MLIYFYKLVFIAIFALIGFRNPPFQIENHMLGALIGGACALALSIFAFRIKKTELKYVWSVTIGILGGIFL